MVRRAIGNGSDWPRITLDPKVNHKVDQLISNPELPDWENLTENERDLYLKEVEIL